MILTETMRFEALINPLYNFSVTKHVKLNSNPNIYLIEFRNQLLGCEKREDGSWYGVTGKNDKTRELINTTLKENGYEIIYKNKYKLIGYDRELEDIEIHIIKEMN